MSIQIELITPEKLAFRDQVDFVAAPAYDGEVGILPGHAPLLTRLGPGELRLKKGDQTFYFALSGGFMEVQHGNRVSVFAETAELGEEIDVERAQQALERAKGKLAQSSDLTPAELAALESSLARAVVRLKIGNIRRRRSGNAPEPEFH